MIVCDGATKSGRAVSAEEQYTGRVPPRDGPSDGHRHRLLRIRGRRDARPPALWCLWPWSLRAPAKASVLPAEVNTAPVPGPSTPAGAPCSDAAATADEILITDVDADDQPARKVPHADPAHVAMCVLVSRALEVAGTSAAEAGRDGTVCLVHLPDAVWTKIARDAWSYVVRNSGQADDGARDTYWESNRWLAWTPDNSQEGHEQRSGEEKFARSVAKGRHCTGFAADLSWLPNDMVQAADYRLEVPRLTAGDVAAVALELCGDSPVESLSDEQAVLLTPRLLRLARRPGQTADAYIVKLRDLLDHALASAGSGANCPAAASASPRAAPTLSRLHGMDEAVRWGLDLARDLRLFAESKISWGDVDRGCLLSGPPGVGKTLFARALAQTCDVPLVSGSYSEWHGTGSAHQGDLLKAMRRTFSKARDSAPCILFIDETDSFPNRATITHHYVEWETQVVNGLLAEIDGVEGREGVVVIGACNHPEKLDPALIRSGRFDRHIRLSLPDRPALSAILREHLGPDLQGVDLSEAAMAGTGGTGADCEKWVRGARRRARTGGRDMVPRDLLDEIGGAENRTDAELWIAAVHEAGHAVAISALRPGTVRAVSIRGDDGGFTDGGRMRSRYLRETDLQQHLIILLAGRAAEEEVLGVASSGAGGQYGSDLERATWLAVTADTAFGFAAGGGLLWRGMPDARELPAILAANAELADRVRVRLDDAYAVVRELMRAYAAAVQDLASVLVTRRVLDGARAENIVRRHIGDGGGRT